MARFFRRGRTKVYFLPAVSNLDAPSGAEITAGIDITQSVAGITGFMFKNSPIKTPDLATTFTTEIPGEDTADQSSFLMYDDDTSTTIRSTLAKNTSGYVLLCPYGNTTGKRCEVWPVVVTTNSDEYTLGNDPARWHLEFSVALTPHQNAVLP